MNKIKIFCLVLAVVLVLPLFAACGSNAVTANVTVIFRVPITEGVDENGDIIYAVDENGEQKFEEKFKYDLLVEGTTENKPTVLQAVQESFLEFELDYEVSKDGSYISSAFGLTEQDTADAETGYFSFWECTINGYKSESGRQSVTEIYEGDEIVFTWTSDSKPRQDTAAVVTTDPNAETTGVIYSDETTIAEDEEELN